MCAGAAELGMVQFYTYRHPPCVGTDHTLILAHQLSATRKKVLSSIRDLNQLPSGSSGLAHRSSSSSPKHTVVPLALRKVHVLNGAYKDCKDATEERGSCFFVRHKHVFFALYRTYHTPQVESKRRQVASCQVSVKRFTLLSRLSSLLTGGTTRGPVDVLFWAVIRFFIRAS